MERPQARHGVQHVGAGSSRVNEWRHESGVGTAQVVVLGVGDELLEGGGVLERVDSASADQLAHLREEEIGGVHGASQ